MTTPDLMDTYDALCLEQEKQAALNEVLSRALNSGQISPETLTSYLLVIRAQHSSATAAAATLYETAFQQENKEATHDR